MHKTHTYIHTYITKWQSNFEPCEWQKLSQNHTNNSVHPKLHHAPLTCYDLHNQGSIPSKKFSLQHIQTDCAAQHLDLTLWVKRQGIWPAISPDLAYGRPYLQTPHMAGHTSRPRIWPAIPPDLAYGRPYLQTSTHYQRMMTKQSIYFPLHRVFCEAITSQWQSETAGKTRHNKRIPHTTLIRIFYVYVPENINNNLAIT
jgi:hypothetical protein